MIKTEWASLIIALLIILDLLIAATRVSLSNIRISQITDQKNKDAERVLALLENHRLWAVLRLSQTLMRFSIAILSFLLLQKYSAFIQIPALVLITLLMLLIEFMVEANALENAEGWALELSAFGRVLIFIFTPLVILPLLLLNPRHISRNSLAKMTEDELKIWVKSEESTELEPVERRMIYEIFQLSETIAREIMVPRIDVLALDKADATLASAVEAFLDSGYSRLPFYDDNIDNILGFLYAKDLLATLTSDKTNVNLSNLLREAHFIPETKKAGDLLAEMQKERFHMAIVVDEYGGVSGVVTLEDIIEEIIGEIQDEYDDSEEAEYQKISESEYLFLGQIDLDDFAEIMEIEIPEDDADTLAGFLYEKLGRVPKGGEKVRAKGLLFTIEQVADRRIRRIRVVDERLLSKEEKDDDKE